MLIAGQMQLCSMYYEPNYRPIAQRFAHNEADQPIPAQYETIIAQEYNNIRGANKYRSMHAIMDQTLRGKSSEQRTQILADLAALQQAIRAARVQAEHDGKRMWQWGYIWKDNSITIDTLNQYETDIAEQLADYQWQSKSDLVKLAYFSSKYLAVGVLSIAALYASQSYILEKEGYRNNKKYGLFDMLAAPTVKSFNTVKSGTKAFLKSISYTLESLDAFAKYTSNLLSDAPEQEEKPADAGQ